MGGIFNLDSKLMRGLTKMADLMWVNILTMVCSIPLFTIGASFTAMHTAVYKLYKDEEGYVSKDFFKAFKSNFKQSTLLWLIYLAVGLILAGDLWLFYKDMVDMNDILKIIILAVGVLYLLSLSWVFVLQSRYENPIKTTIKNTLLVSMTQILYSLMMILLFIAPVVLVWFVEQAVPICFLFGFSAPAFLQAMLYSRVFDRIENPKSEEDGEEKAADAEEAVEDGQIDETKS